MPGSVPVNGAATTPMISKSVGPTRRLRPRSRIAVEAACPVALGDHGHRVQPDDRVVAGSEQPAGGRPEPQRREEVARDVLQLRLLEDLTGIVTTSAREAYDTPSRSAPPTSPRMRTNSGYSQPSNERGGPSAPWLARTITCSRSASSTGSGRNSSASMTTNVVRQAPRASASETIAAAERVFDR